MAIRRDELQPLLDNFIGLGRLHKPVPNNGKPVVNKGHHNKVKGNKS